MTWLRKQRVRTFVENSMWLLPVTGLFLGLLVVRWLHWLEMRWHWESAYQPEGARAVLGTLASSMFTFVIFVSSALLIAFQLASAQLSPRLIAIVFRDPVTKWSLTLFVFTFAVTMAALVRVDDAVPPITTRFTIFCCIASLGAFLHLIDHVARVLRPSGALRSVARIGRRVIEEVYPRILSEQPAEPALASALLERSSAAEMVVRSGSAGAVLAFDRNGLAALARATDCRIEMAPRVGNFVVPGDPLFRVSPARNGVTVETLLQSIAIGQERSVEQDPMLIFRILVDIAAKALSPAINDPTTAALAIDQLHHLLRVIGVRDLDEGQVVDADGRVLLTYRTPDWEDFVRLAVSEIRMFGGASLQVARRLRAMMENLIEVLPESRRLVLQREMRLLEKTVERGFPEPEDRALAYVSDLQGVGGAKNQVRP